MKVATWDNYVRDVEREGVRQLRTEARLHRERLRRLVARERQSAFDNGKDAGKRLAEYGELEY